jgi:hypothetical protein
LAVEKAGVTEQLAAKAARGIRVRILIAAEGSIYLIAHDQELGQASEASDTDQTPVSELKRVQAIEALEPLLNAPGVEIRAFVAGRPNTILRFDEQMLVTMQLYGINRAASPQLRLRQRQDEGIFDQFAGHFDRIWDGAGEELELDSDPRDLPEDPRPTGRPAVEADGAPTPQQAQIALDRLRAHRTL